VGGPGGRAGWSGYARPSSGRPRMGAGSSPAGSTTGRARWLNPAGTGVLMRQPIRLPLKWSTGCFSVLGALGRVRRPLRFVVRPRMKSPTGLLRRPWSSVYNGCEAVPPLGRSRALRSLSHDDDPHPPLGRARGVTAPAGRAGGPHSRGVLAPARRAAPGPAGRSVPPGGGIRPGEERGTLSAPGMIRYLAGRRQRVRSREAGR